MRNKQIFKIIAAVAFVAPLSAQTKIDLSTQSKKVDFSGASSTKPFKTGPLLPGGCTVGESFFNTSAASGQNLYGCVAANIWSVLSGGGSGGGGGSTVQGGTGVVTIQAGNSTTVALDTAVVPTILTTSQVMAFSSIAAGACSPELTMALNGAAVGDAVAPGWPADLPSGLVGMMRVAAINTVGVTLCNFTSTAISSTGTTIRAMIVKGF